MSSYVLAPKNLTVWLLVQTYTFVAFNKVITAQYFTWYAIFILLVIPIPNSVKKNRNVNTNTRIINEKKNNDFNFFSKKWIFFQNSKNEKENKNKLTKNCNFNIFLILMLWVFALCVWLYRAYKLEFLGLNTFLSLWMAGIFFHIVNSLIIILIILFFKETKKEGRKKGK